MNFLFILVIVFILIKLRDIGNKSHNIYVKWIGRIVPPSIFFTLIFVPKNIMTSPLWLISFVLSIYSFFLIIKRIIKFTISKFKKETVSYTHLVYVLITPTIIITAFFLSNYMINLSITSANRHALNLALNMKEFVNKNGVCKYSLDGWELDSKVSQDVGKIIYGEYGTKYLIRYRCSQKENSFSFTVRLNIDEDFSIKYRNENLIVTYGHFNHPTKVTLNESTDLNALAKCIK